jgi:hypothetical protein
VVPSISFPAVELVKITAVQAYEERMLFVLLLLRNPELRVVFVTSSPVDPATVDYYLRFLPDPGDARRRLTMLDAGDPAIGSLSAKLLVDPERLDAVRAALGGAGAMLLPFNVTRAEEALADAVGAQLYGPPAGLVSLGSKSGSRQVARRAGVPCLEGAEDLYSLEAVAAAIEVIRARRPGAEAVVVKLNNGFSGIGNAILELDGLAHPLTQSKTTFCAAEECWDTYEHKIAAEGCIVEELVRAEGLASPSAQLRIAPDGEVELLSTHDQILGGAENQVYIGCRFPAGEAYRATIIEEATKVGAELSAEGVIGSFGIDFLVVPERGVYLSEINLRMGGTTHPYWMARLASGGTYDPARGELIGPGGRPLSYLATDNLKAERLVGSTPAEVIGRVDEAGLAFDPSLGTGVTVHLLGAVHGYGKMGATCVAHSQDAASDLYARLVTLLSNR